VEPDAAAKGPPPPRALYIVGPWADTAVDPSLWGHGGVPLTDLTVRSAMRRLVRLFLYM
jgi:hypothetical protein